MTQSESFLPQKGIRTADALYFIQNRAVFVHLMVEISQKPLQTPIHLLYWKHQTTHRKEAVMNPIFLENDIFRLTVGDDCIVKSLILKSSGEELIDANAETALFSVTQERPYNNEIKLIHMNKETTFEVNLPKVQKIK